MPWAQWRMASRVATSMWGSGRRISWPTSARREAKAPSVMVGKLIRSLTSGRRGQLAQGLAVDLARGRPRQLADDLDAARILVLAQLLAHVLLQLAREVLARTDG